jgi:hypothetical protein
VPHFQVTFTLPDSLSRLILANRRPLYNLLFRAAWQTLQELAADPKYLGGQTGAVMVLHTWNQLLEHHPHVHAVVPAGVLAPDGRWQACDPKFFIEVEVLSDTFRKKFLDGLERLYSQGKLQLQDKLSPLADPGEFDRQIMARERDRSWVVHVERPPSACRHPEAVLKYLARYVAGNAISDRRLISHDHGQVTFWVKDRDSGQSFPAELEGLEFTRRFMMHVLPKGFQRVRYRGLYHSANRNTFQPKIREQLLAQNLADNTADDPSPLPAESQDLADVSAQQPTCPACGVGRLERITSRDTPHNWLQVLCASPFQPSGRQWEELDLADWTPVVHDDPPPPLQCSDQMSLRLIFDESPHDDAQTIQHARGQPPTNSYPKAA